MKDVEKNFKPIEDMLAEISVIKRGEQCHELLKTIRTTIYFLIKIINIFLQLNCRVCILNVKF